MNKTKIFIKMSEKAVEIQEDDTKHNFGNIVSFDVHPHANFSRATCTILCSLKSDNTVRLASKDNRGFTVSWDRCIWLPTQGQLQKMVFDKKKHLDGSGLAYSFDKFLETLDDNNIAGLSMEQLWLAFVMKELYNKIWNGEDWI